MKLVNSAYHRDKFGNLYSGEALVLMLLLRARGKAGRLAEDEEYVADLLDKGDFFTADK